MPLARWFRALLWEGRLIKRDLALSRELLGSRQLAFSLALYVRGLLFVSHVFVFLSSTLRGEPDMSIQDAIGSP